MKKQQVLFSEKQKPILSHLQPVRIAGWRADGLFRRGKFDVGQKVRFIVKLRSMAFDMSHATVQRARVEGNTMDRGLIMTEKKMETLAKFNAISDADMREIMKAMIVSESLLGARYVAKKLKYPWPQFVLDFNYALEQMMEVYANV